MNAFSTVTKAFDYTIKDTVKVVAFVVALLGVFAPSLFFGANGDMFRTGILAYVLFGTVIIQTTNVGHSTKDLSANALKIGVYTVALGLLYGLTITANPEVVSPFTSPLSALIFFVFIVGYWESILRAGLSEIIGSDLFAAVIMGVAHTTAYTVLLGTGPGLITAIITSVVAFFLFGLIYRATNNDLFIEALAHGLYDYYVYGFGLIALIGI